MPVSIENTVVRFNDGTTQSTAGQPGTVTSVATGNGLQGGTITTSGTLSVACPAFNSVGSYSLSGFTKSDTSTGGNYSGWLTYSSIDGCSNPTGLNGLSGAWKLMGISPVGHQIICRVS